MRSGFFIGACAIVAIGCEAVSPSKQPSGDPNEIVLEPALGLPRFEIRATFDAGLEPRNHIQPLAAALATARSACFTKDVAPAVRALALDVEVRATHVHAEARNPASSCMARELDGKTIDDRASYKVTLVVAVG